MTRDDANAWNNPTYVVLARQDEVFAASNIVHVGVCYMHG